MRKRHKRYERIISRAPQTGGPAKMRRLRRWMAVVLVMILVLSAVAGLMLWQSLQPAQNPASSSTAVPSSEPVESETSELPVPDNSWALTIVSPTKAASSDLKPTLATFDKVQVDRRIVPALQKLMEDAKEQGYSLTIDRGYVSADQQEQLYQQRVKELMQNNGSTRAMAESTAASEIPRGGYGENQTGLAVDFGGGSALLSSDAYYWLTDKCVDYGFVLRYTESKESQTGLAANPYHFRYVGTQNAQAMRRMGLCLEEYVSYLAQQEAAN